MSLVEEIYECAKDLPKREQYGLLSQMCRAAVSIPSNIAEGNKCGTRKDYTSFLRIAAGSGAELETQILLCQKIYPDIDFDTALSLLSEVQRMLTVIIKKLT